MGRCLLLACFALLVSCVETTGVPYEVAVRRASIFVAGIPESEGFGQQVIRGRRGTQFDFIEGNRWNKSDLLFPLRVATELSPIESGEDSILRVTAYKHALLTRSKRPEVAKNGV